MQRLENRLIKADSEAHNIEARRINRRMYLSKANYMFIPIIEGSGASIGPTHLCNADDVMGMTAIELGAFSAFYSLTHITWLAYANAGSTATCRCKVLVFLGALD